MSTDEQRRLALAEIKRRGVVYSASFRRGFVDGWLASHASPPDDPGMAFARADREYQEAKAAFGDGCFNDFRYEDEEAERIGKLAEVRDAALKRWQEV